MPIQETKFIWRNGEYVDWADATTHVMTHAMHYGTAVFEGMRAYDTKHLGPAVFRNKEHIKRLLFSAKVYRINIGYTIEELTAVCRDIVRKNGLRHAYLRPLAYLGYGEFGLGAQNVRTDVMIAAFPLGAYLGDEALKEGIDVCVSSWRRLAPSTMPAGVKAAGNYLSSRLISMEAKDRGFAEGIGLAHDGTVSEGAGENIFIAMNGKLITPPGASSILLGITRDTVMTLARARGIEVVEAPIAREMLYGADEVFMTGTAAEISSVKSVDRIAIGDGQRPITKEISRAFFGLFSGETKDEWGWLDPIG